MYRSQKLADLDATGFDVETRDGVIGRVDRATKDVRGSYLVIDPGAAMPLGRRVVVPAGVVDTVDVSSRRLFVDAGRNEVLSAPEFDPARPLDDALLDRIGTHFSSPRRTGRTQRRTASRSSTARPATRRRSASQKRSRSSTSRPAAEPTRDELYQQAKKLGIEGRSKLNKAQLKRAVQRRK